MDAPRGHDVDPPACDGAAPDDGDEEAVPAAAPPLELPPVEPDGPATPDAAPVAVDEAAAVAPVTVETAEEAVFATVVVTCAGAGADTGVGGSDGAGGV